MAPVLGILFLLLIGGLFIWWCAQPAKANPVAPPPEPEPAAQPPPPPLSCLALGIIKSLDEEPDAWTDFKHTMERFGYADGINHSINGTTILHEIRYIGEGQFLDLVDIENIHLPANEATAVGNALRQRRAICDKREADAKAKEAEPRLEYFKKIGCPEGEAK